jgi:hypothetical protein
MRLVVFVSELTNVGSRNAGSNVGFAAGASPITVATLTPKRRGSVCAVTS